jgi:hypothetical protein
MRLDLRELVVLVVLAAAYCVCFFIEPDWNVTEAHRLCDGEPTQVFESMSACAVGQRPGCTCMRPESPWAYVFWLVMLPSIGIAAAVLLRSNLLPSAVLLTVALAAAGACALLMLSRRESFEDEAWVFAPYVVGVEIVIVVGTFGIARAVRYWILTKRAAT